MAQTNQHDKKYQANEKSVIIDSHYKLYKHTKNKKIETFFHNTI